MSFVMNCSRVWPKVVDWTVGAFLLGAALLCVSGCRQATPPEPPKVVQKPLWDTLFSVHSAGSRQILSDTNAATLRALLELPETGALGTNLEGRITSAVAGFISAAGQMDMAREWISPLILDFVGREFWLAHRKPQRGDSEWSCAVLLDSEKLPIWQTNLWQLLVSMGPGSNEVRSLATTGSIGFELALSNRTVRVASVGNWLLCGIGTQALPGFADMVSTTTTTGRPVPNAADYWVRCELDVDKLNVERNLILGAPLSKVVLSVAA